MAISSVLRHRLALLALIIMVMLRMFGLFLALPVIAPYANTLPGASAILVSLALGGYGLTQACLQVPLGLLSDKWGRKPVIAIGLLLFLLGSLIAAHAESIYQLILGRLLQGSGAISAASMALLADLTSERRRTQAMALYGISVGMAFTIALLLGPIFQNWHGVTGLFDIAVIGAALALLLLALAIPTTKQQTHQDMQVRRRDIAKVISHPALMKLNLSVFFLHGLLAISFLGLPLILNEQLHFSREAQTWLYLPAMLSSFILAMPIIIMAEGRQLTAQVLKASIMTISIAMIGFALISYHPGLLNTALFLFFLGFNAQEAMLPSLVSKLAPKTYKGTALGIYATSQFLGMFVGSLIGGLVMRYSNTESIFIVALFGCMLWLWQLLTLDKNKLTILNIEESEYGQQRC